MDDEMMEDATGRVDVPARLAVMAVNNANVVGTNENRVFRY
jgi:hypothetical protein